VVGLLTLVLRIKEQENGAMLPMAFQSVLYLDVFGWVAHKNTQTPEATQMQASQMQTRTAARASLPAPAVTRASTTTATRTRKKEPEPIGYYAMDYFESEGGRGGPAESRLEEEDDSEAESVDGDGPDGAQSRCAQGQAGRPTLSTLRYDEKSGKPLPTRPVDAARPGAADDMRLNPDAPRMWEEVNAIAPPGKEFWDPVTFMPREVRSRQSMDWLFSEVGRPNFNPDAGKGAAFGEKEFFSKAKSFESASIVTGHDNEMPGLLPYRVFKMAAVVTSFVWFAAALYYILDAANVFTSVAPWASEIEAVRTSQLTYPNATRSSPVVPSPSLLSLWAAGFSGGHVGPGAERVEAVWPYPSIAPVGLSCDAAGGHFLVTDGLSAYSAELQESTGDSGARAGGKSSARLRQSLAATSPPTPHATFRQVPRCPAVLGMAVQDAAVVCSGGNGTEYMSACEALVLHHGGDRIAACPLRAGDTAEHPAKFKGADSVSSISLDGLGEEEAPAASHGRRVPRESAAWLLLDPGCGAGHGGASVLREGCASVRTTHGRVAMLKQRASGKELVPEDIVEEINHLAVKGKADNNQPQIEATRTFNNRYLGVLQEERRSIQVVDTSNNGAPAGTILLPATPGPVKGFCVGGGHIYLLEQGPSPSMWRFPLPSSLQGPSDSIAL
jgi:hypothetical protein